MRDNLYSWCSGFTLSGISMYNGWITVENTIEVAFYGFIGGVVGMLGKYLVLFFKSRFSRLFPKHKSSD